MYNRYALYILVFLLGCVIEAPKKPAPKTSPQVISPPATTDYVVEHCIESGDFPGSITDPPMYGRLTTPLGFQVAVPLWVPTMEYGAVGRGIDYYWRVLVACMGPDFATTTQPAIGKTLIIIPQGLANPPIPESWTGPVEMHGWYYFKTPPRNRKPSDGSGAHCVHARWRGEADLLGKITPVTTDFLPVLNHELQHWYWFLRNDSNYGDERRILSNDCSRALPAEPWPTVALD